MSQLEVVRHSLWTPDDIGEVVEAHRGRRGGIDRCRIQPMVDGPLTEVPTGGTRYATPAVVQKQAAAASGTGVTVSVTLPSGTPALGNTLMAFFASRTGSPNYLNHLAPDASWHFIVGKGRGNGSPQTSMWWKPVGASEPTTIGFRDPNATGSSTLAVYEVSGINNSQPFDSYIWSGVDGGASNILTLALGPQPWAAGTAYGIGAFVTSGGITWLALVASTGVTPGTDATKWIPVTLQTTTSPAFGFAGIATSNTVTFGNHWTNSFVQQTVQTMSTTAARTTAAGTYTTFTTTEDWTTGRLGVGLLVTFRAKPI